ncbi:MAG: biotin--[acetyl-CoA-carboxylase] ligase [Alphaproteobacteria bacterium]|nr:biotin--[acetyl-CoA-carboxylase] ligase [Alphaproteobacteria bacterium]
MQDPFATCRDATPILELDEIGSTNAEAMRRAASGECGPLWIKATRQTAGRGRDGRAWQSPAGNLHASLLVTLWTPPADLPKLSLLAGVALATAMAGFLPAHGSKADRPHLKWPNDLLFGNAKSAGILVETTLRAPGAFNCVLGFGANIVNAPEIPGRAVTCLANQHVETAPSQLLAAIDRALRDGFAALSTPDGFSRVRDAWLRNAHPVGTLITVNSPERSYKGRFAGLDRDGALLLKDETGSLSRIDHGDVSADDDLV